jgi:uncharacterized protein YkwD
MQRLRVRCISPQDVGTTTERSIFRTRRRHIAAAAISIAAASAIALSALCGPASGRAAAAEPAPLERTESAVNEAHDAVNAVRQLSGLDTVALDPALSVPAASHSCWMVQNDTLSHSETPGSPGYTPAGSASGGRSNVAVSSSPTATARSFVSLWMTGPYHAVGVLDPRLGSVGYGQCSDEAGTWRSGGTLDILGGLGAGDHGRVVTFPGDRSAVPWTSFITESPNPLANCTSGGGQWSSAGLPIFALLPEAPAPGASATLIGPDGAPIEVCVITEHNDVSPTGRSILGGRRAMVAVPRHALADGHYEVRFDTGARIVTWGFDVDKGAAGPYAKLAVASQPRPVVTGAAVAATYVPHVPERTWDTRQGVGRLRGGVEYSLPVGEAPAGATAVVVNITTTQTDAGGWAAVYPCGNFGGTSTSNFADGRTGSTTTIVQLGAKGVCVRTESSTHVIADVTGWMVAGDHGAGFVPGESRRYDSRESGIKLSGGERVRVVVAQPGTTAAALNVTTTAVDAAGFVTVWPCTSAGEPVPTVSLGQGRPGPDQAAFGIVPVAADGAVCLYASSRMHVIVDVAGTFVDDAGSRFVAFNPLRRFDTRRSEPWASPSAPGARLAPADAVALALGVDGMPDQVDAVMANVTVTSTGDRGWLGVKPCGDAAQTSDVNFDRSDTVANMTLVPTAPSADACAALSSPSHLVVDLFGVFVP